MQTACSTSLVAIVQACQGLVELPDGHGAGRRRLDLVSPAAWVRLPGGCDCVGRRPHAHVRRGGAGHRFQRRGGRRVLLKRLEDARADGDPDHRGDQRSAAINNDGAGKVSFTAPSVDGQAEVIQMAQALAGVDAGRRFQLRRGSRHGDTALG